MKPNRHQIPNLFDENFVHKQLETSGTMAYCKLMQLGFPIKMPIAELSHKLKLCMEPHHTMPNIGVNNCCIFFLLASGFHRDDFRLGKTAIHFRPGKCHLLDKMKTDFQESNNLQIAIKFKKGFNAFIRRSLYISIRFVGACTYFSGISYNLKSYT